VRATSAGAAVSEAADAKLMSPAVQREGERAVLVDDGGGGGGLVAAESGRRRRLPPQALESQASPLGPGPVGRQQPHQGIETNSTSLETLSGRDCQPFYENLCET